MSTTIPEIRTRLTDVDDMRLHNYLSAGETKIDTTDYVYAEKSTTTLQVLHTVTDHRTETQEDTLLLLVLLYVHRNRRFIRDGSTGRPPPPSHSS